MKDELEVFLQKLALQGESIVAEIVRLSNFIGNDWTESSSSRFKKILIDFKYFEKPDAYERDLSEDGRIQNLFYCIYGSVITAFELLFNSIAEFILTLKRYSEEQNGLARTNDNLNQLEIYCLYQCGLIVIHLDKLFTPGTRQKLFVAIYRKTDDRKYCEFLVDFFKSCSKRNDYLIERCLISKEFVRNCINMIESYNIDKRVILKNVPQLTYICLLFDKTILINDSSRMNRIVNSIYREDWVFNIGFITIVNLFDDWYNYKSAHDSLMTMISTADSNSMATHHLRVLTTSTIPKGNIELSDYEEQMRFIFELNKSLRWLFLHTNSVHGGNRGKIILNSLKYSKDKSKFDDFLIKTLLEISDYELKLECLYESKLLNRSSQVEKSKKAIQDFLKELSNYFSYGCRNLNSSQKENFSDWLDSLANAIKNVSINEVADSDELLQQIGRRIKQVGQILGMKSNYTLEEYLTNIDLELKKLSHLIRAESNGLNYGLDMVQADYLWPLLDLIIPKIQLMIISKSNINCVRQLFSKLSKSILSLDGMKPKDKQYRKIMNTYSYYLESKLRNVLQTIPHNIFEIMKNVINNEMRSIPSGYIDKEKLMSLQTNRNNRKLVESTFIITNTSLGISRMMLKQIGTVQINPKKLLEDSLGAQLKKELINFENKIENIDELIILFEKLRDMKQSFIYISELMNIDGLSIWNRSIDDWFVKMFEEGTCSVSSAICKTTNPKNCRYNEEKMEFKDVKSNKSVLSLQFFEKIDFLLPNYGLVMIETGIRLTLETILKDFFTKWSKKISSSTKIKVTESEEELQKMCKYLNSNESNFVMQLAEIGQMVLLWNGIVRTKRLGNELRECGAQRMVNSYNEFLLSDINLLSKLSSNRILSAITGIFEHYSTYDPEKILFDVKTDGSCLPVICILHGCLKKIGDSSFYCPTMLKYGIKVVLQQFRSFQSDKDELKEVIKNSFISKCANNNKMKLAHGFLLDIIEHI